MGSFLRVSSCMETLKSMFPLFIYFFFYHISDKNEAEVDRETSLVEQWIGLTEERNAVLVPAAGSGIPGAPADR